MYQFWKDFIKYYYHALQYIRKTNQNIRCVSFIYYQLNIFGLNGLRQGLQRNILVLKTHSSFVTVSDDVHFGQNILD